jgi:hypothetical protein
MSAIDHEQARIPVSPRMEIDKESMKVSSPKIGNLGGKQKAEDACLAWA